MATITSAATGNWSAGATWVGGIAPVNGDKVYIAHTSSAASSFSTNTAGYAIGATAITLTGTVLAGSYVVGEAVTFYGDPNYYQITNWVVATKVLTIAPLIIAIPAAATRVTSRGHVVTIDTNAIEGGDDTSTAINVTGTLKFSRTAASQLTVQGELLIITKGTFDMGQSADPIPLAYTATLKLNRSAALVDGKWGATTQDNSGIYIYGAAKTTNALLVSDISAGATTARVTNGTGWNVNDRVIFAGTGTSATQQDVKTISTITLVSGTIYDITFAATTYAHAANCPVGNFTNNCIFTVYNTTYRSYFDALWNTAQTINSREIRYLTFEEFVTNTAGGLFQKQAGLTLRVSSSASLGTAWISIANIAWYQTTAGGGCIQFSNNKLVFEVNDTAMYGVNTGTSILGYAGGVVTQRRTFIYRTASCITFGYSEGTRDHRFYDCYFTGFSSSGINFNGGIEPKFYNCYWFSGSQLLVNSTCNSPLFDTNYFGSGASTPTGASMSQSSLVSSAVGGLGSCTMLNCYFDATKAVVGNAYNTAAATLRLDVTNKNAIVTAHEIYYPNGSFYRENTIISRGKSSIKFSQQVANIAQSFLPIYIPAPNNTAVIIKGRLRKNSSYGASTMPTVALSGLGIAPQSFTMTDTTDTWEEFTFTVTQTSGNDGNLTLTFTCQSSSTSAIAYLDGVLYSPFTQYIDYYGYSYAPTTPTLTVDPIITQATEATVAAYTGISIAGTTITVSSNHTMAEIYDYCQYYRVINQLAPFLTSSDGVSYNSDYSIDITGTAVLTGTGGTLTILTGKTATMAVGTSLASLQIVSVTSGNTGLLSITSIPTDSSVAIYDNSGAQVDFVASSPTSYSKFLTLAHTGTWKYIIKKAGYSAHIGTFDANDLVDVTAAIVQKLNGDGTVAYTATTSALGTVTFATTVQANIDIANGTYGLQAVFDEAEVAMTTSNGMDWLAAGLSEISIFNSAGGDFLFLPTKWRLRRASAGDVNATLAAFAISADGMPVDGVNGSVAYLTSDSPTAIASAVWAAIVSSNQTVGSFGAIAKMIENKVDDNQALIISKG